MDEEGRGELAKKEKGCLVWIRQPSPHDGKNLPQNTELNIGKTDDIKAGLNTKLCSGKCSTEG